MADENWTEQTPEDAEIDARVDAILRANGISEPAQNGRSFLVAVVLPVIAGGYSADSRIMVYGRSTWPL